MPVFPSGFSTPYPGRLGNHDDVPASAVPPSTQTTAPNQAPPGGRALYLGGRNRGVVPGLTQSIASREAALADPATLLADVFSGDAGGANAHGIQERDGLLAPHALAPATAMHAPKPSALINHANHLFEQDRLYLCEYAQVHPHTLDAWLHQSGQRSGFEAEPELLAASRMVFARALSRISLNHRLSQSSEADPVPALLDSDIQPYGLLQRLPQECQRLSEMMSHEDWKTINHVAGTLSLLTLAVLQEKLAERSCIAVDLVTLAKSKPCCRELVALTQPAPMGEHQLMPNDRIHFAACDEGWKCLQAADEYSVRVFDQRLALTMAQVDPLEIENRIAAASLNKFEVYRILSTAGPAGLGAAQVYLDGVAGHRSTLAMQGLGQNAVDDMLAAITFSKDELVNLLAHPDGVANLEAGERAVQRLVERRANLARAGHAPEAIEAALARTAFLKSQLTSILSHPGGAKNLKAGEDYLRRRDEQVTVLKMAGRSDAEITSMLEPTAFSVPELTRILSHENGWANLAAGIEQFRGVEMARTAFQLRGTQGAQLSQALILVWIGKTELVQLLSSPYGVQQLNRRFNR
ncbi:MAG: hypothetical protein ACRYGK_17435 [Janthinobacterium lividum]